MLADESDGSHGIASSSVISPARASAPRRDSPQAALSSGSFDRHAFLFRLDVPNLTPSMLAFCCVAVTERLSLRAMMVVFAFSYASVLSIRTSSFVHGLAFFVVFAIALSSESKNRTLEGFPVILQHTPHA